jgi:hypothetical protein
VGGAQFLGDPSRRAAVVDEVRASAPEDAIPLLQAVAALHEHKAVAKAARKALFRLGIRR